jgi:hypothetical protein
MAEANALPAADAQLLPSLSICTTNHEDKKKVRA